MMLSAIFGGTFNPFHIGHYEILKSLNDDPDIEKILLMPDRIPPHKTPQFVIDDDTRIEMCRIVASEFKKCELCLIEFEREGKSYTYDTVKLLQESNKDTEFAFVCGGDMFVYFDKWYKYKELMKMLPFIVYKRTVTDDNEFNLCLKRFTGEGMSVIIKNDLIPTVSSTMLRENKMKNRELFPPKVYKFLTERGVCGE